MLMHYLEGEAVLIDNNLVGNQAGSWALGRPSYLFFRSLRGGKPAKAIMSLIYRRG
ncbi:hypothetical protein DYL61_17695 [Pseudomonas nabeulensis]|uniref:Uncharacterized protein n=1 Tax=Pseudomonas nabeulensis TaxID=2293833 RepID=A0A4Z0AZT7_9PSED|nr:hypothetical protein DYL61_17695 [Pseudomonas nabeulensis]